MHSTVGNKQLSHQNGAMTANLSMIKSFILIGAVAILMPSVAAQCDANSGDCLAAKSLWEKLGGKSPISNGCYIDGVGLSSNCRVTKM